MNQSAPHLRLLFTQLVCVLSLGALAVEQPGETTKDGVPGNTSPQTTIDASGSILSIPWPARDGLGRDVVCSGDPGARPPRTDKYVGIFYFGWHPPEPAQKTNALRAPGPWNVTEVLLANPKALGQYDTWPGPANAPKAPRQKGESPFGGMFHWNEPLYGYYLLTDPWVIDRHLRQLSDLGVDFLLMDATNGLIYEENYGVLLDRIVFYRKQGRRVPEAAFMLNTETKKTFDRLWKAFYASGRWDAAWFQWKGRPLISADRSQIAKEMHDKFTFRATIWPVGKNHQGFAWMLGHPQPYGYDTDPKRPESVSVSAAQNLKIKGGSPGVQSNGDCRGRSFHDGKQPVGLLPPYPEMTLQGLNFSEQFAHALTLDPELIFVTSWNEWTAGRWIDNWGKGPAQFCDQFTDEYSRDLEMSKGPLADHYVHQLADRIRRFKGVPEIPRASGLVPLSAKPDGPFAPWKQVVPVFTDWRDKILERDHPGYGSLHYRDQSGRNNLVQAQVACDTTNLAFRIECAAPIALPDGAKRIWLFLDTDQNPGTGWEGYDVIINRLDPSGRELSVERHDTKFAWHAIGSAQFRLSGNALELLVDRKLLGLQGESLPRFDFKWADNLQKPGDVMDFYLSGDVAPGGRFRYRFEGKL
ncbi:hypothetical protein LBMAG53_25380 [Planctomycetota bacterium]|nr:hypothetical protein LBMAG53_25380 [Planctomycetota bacterium]